MAAIVCPAPRLAAVRSGRASRMPRQFMCALCACIALQLAGELWMPRAAHATESSIPASLQPFVSDGCSLFPDRALIGKDDWCGCCVAHDLAYWRGGTSDERLTADKALRACVLRTTANSALAELMYEGVRAGGGPYFYTPYRWGYGWQGRHAYAPLSPEEAAQAARLAQAYLSQHSAPVCPAPASASSSR